MRPFPDLMRHHLDGREYSQRRFAAVVGSTSAYISLVCGGKRNAPDLPVVYEWAKALKLGERDTEELALSAALSRAAPVLQRYVADLERRQGSRNARQVASR